MDVEYRFVDTICFIVGARAPSWGASDVEISSNFRILFVFRRRREGKYSP